MKLKKSYSGVTMEPSSSCNSGKRSKPKYSRRILSISVLSGEYSSWNRFAMPIERERFSSACLMTVSIWKIILLKLQASLHSWDCSTYSVDISVNLTQFFDMRHLFLHQQLQFTAIFSEHLFFSVGILNLIYDSKLKFFKLNCFQSIRRRKYSVIMLCNSFLL